MRLKKIERGQGIKARAFFGMIRALSGHRAPDVIRTIKYRPELWGAPFSDLTQEVMRGDSEWSVGERELFAGFVSHSNQCPF
jgi:hypothetical protein